MLNHAFENDLGLLPFLILGFFAGIRPDGEFQKLEWLNVKFPEATIVIRPEVSKTNRRRFVDLSPNATEWIEAFRRQGGKLEGRISPFYTASVPGTPARELENSRHQGMAQTRHASHVLLELAGGSKDVNKLVLQSGHNSIDTMWRHYHKGAPEVEAKKFWAIMPSSTANNVVRMIA
jgi:integrase